MLEPSEEAKKLLSPEELKALQAAYQDFEQDVVAKPISGAQSSSMPPGKADFPPLLSPIQSGEDDQPAQEPLR
jgi:hypothetical protein